MADEPREYGVAPARDKVSEYRFERIEALGLDRDTSAVLACRRAPMGGYQYDLHYIEHVVRDLGATPAQVRAMLL